MESGNTLYAFAEVFIYLTTLLLAFYVLVLGYHWFNYGSNKKISVTALMIFVAGSTALAIGLITTYNFL